MKYSALLISIFLSVTSLGQNQQMVDSLITVINGDSHDADKALALVRLSDEYAFSNLDTMPVLCNLAIGLAEPFAHNNEFKKFNLANRAVSEAWNNMGFYYHQKGNLGEAKKCYLIARDPIMRINDLEMLSSIGLNYARAIAEELDYKRSLEILDQLDKLTKQNNLHSERAVVNNNTGWIFHNLRDYSRSILKYKISVQIKKEIGETWDIGTSYNNIGTSYIALGQLDSAEHYLNTAIDYHKEQNQISGLTWSLANLGYVRQLQNDTLSAYENYEQSLELCRSTGIKLSWIETLYKLSQLKLDQQKISEARKYVSELDSLLPTYPTLTAKIYSAELKVRVHQMNSNWKLAFEDLTEYVHLKDSADRKSETIKIIAQEIKSEEKSKQLKLEYQLETNQLLLSEESKRNQLTKIILTLGIALLLISGLLLLIYFRQKQKASKTKLELEKVKNDKLQLEMDQKNRELTSFSLRVAQNTQFVENVDKLISEVRDSSNEEIEDKLRELKVETKLSKRKEQDWVDFQKQFESVHTTFTQNLLLKFPKLTPTEIRLCTLIKLNINTKDIASLLGVSTNTLKSSRYRIHKKMELEKGQELAEFILKFN